MSTHGGGQTRARTTTARSATAKATAAKATSQQHNRFLDATMPTAERAHYRDLATSKPYESRKWNHPAPVMAAPRMEVHLPERPNPPSFDTLFAQAQATNKNVPVPGLKGVSVYPTYSHGIGTDAARTLYNERVAKAQAAWDRMQAQVAKAAPSDSPRAQAERAAWNSLPVRTLSGKAHDLQIDLDHARMAVYGQAPGTPQRRTAEARYARLEARLNDVYAQRAAAITAALGGKRSASRNGTARTVSRSSSGATRTKASRGVTEQALAPLRTARYFSRAQANTMARYAMQQHPNWGVGRPEEPRFFGSPHSVPVTLPDGRDAYLSSWADYERLNATA